MIFYADLILNADLKCLVEQDRSMNAAIEAVAAKIMGRLVAIFMKSRSRKIGC